MFYAPMANRCRIGTILIVAIARACTALVDRSGVGRFLRSMQATLNCTWLIAMISDLMFSGAGHQQPLVIVRRRGTKAMRLSIDPRDASVRLSLPLRAPLRPALVWAAGKRGWIEAELAKMPRAQPIAPGMCLMVAGEAVVLNWSADHPRMPKLLAGTLRVGGPGNQMPARVIRFLKRLALETLARETHDLAALHGITVGKIGIGDPKSRWGSCASSGDIRYSWRLILAPSHVRVATVAHEVAHRVHMNHSREFHDLVAKLIGADPAPARRWLRANGTALHWIGR
jgi:predicted metal-dependent hydrolase